LGRQGFPALKQSYFWIVLVMLLLVIGQHFGIQPVMQALKDQAMPQAVMESAFKDRFAAWHGVSSIVYLVVSLLGLVLVWRYRGN
jgi:heme/copper-type cytochrome/quinol oxidase subunit 2